MQLKNYFKFLFKRSTVFKFVVFYCFLICSTIIDCDYNNKFIIRNNLLIAENNSQEVLDELISVLEKRIGKQEAINIVKHQYLDQIVKDYSDISSFKLLIEHLERTYGKATVIILLRQNFLLKKYLTYKKNFTDILISLSSFMDKESFLKFIVSTDDNTFKISSYILCSNLDMYKKYFSSKELTQIFFKRMDHLSSFSYIKSIILELETILTKPEIKNILLQEEFYESTLHDKKIYEILKIFNSFMNKERLRIILTTNNISYFNTPYYLSLNFQRTLDIMKISKKYLTDTECLDLLDSQEFINIFCNSSEILLENFEKTLQILCLDEDNVSGSYLYLQGTSNLILTNISELYRAVYLSQSMNIYNFIYDFKYKNSVLNKLIYLLKYNDPLFEMIENPEIKISGVSFQEFYNTSYNKLFDYLRTIVEPETYNILEQDPNFNAYIDSLSLIKLEKFKLSTFILYHNLDKNLFNQLMLKDYKNCLVFLKYLCSLLSNVEPASFYMIVNNPVLIEKLFYISNTLSDPYFQDFHNILNYLNEILTNEILLNYLSYHIEDILQIIHQNPNNTSVLIDTLRNTIIDIIKTHNKDTVYRILNSNPDKILNKSKILKLFNIKDCVSLFSFFKNWNILKIFG